MKPRRFWRFCVDACLFCTRQDRLLIDVIAKRWELAHDASLSTISRWLKVVDTFLNQVLFSRTPIQNLFSQSHCHIPCQGVLFCVAKRTLTLRIVAQVAAPWATTNNVLKMTGEALWMNNKSKNLLPIIQIKQSEELP